MGLESQPQGMGNARSPVGIARTGEAEGHIMVKNEAGIWPVASVVLELLGDGGVFKQNTVSEFDGFFVFQKLSPGRYQVRVSELSLQRYGWQGVPGRELVIGSDGGIVSGLEFEVEK